MLIFCVIGTPAQQSKPGKTRSDGAFLVNISKTGSLQNPAWSPDSKSLLFTRFRGGYNREPADLFIVALETDVTRTLVSDGSGNISLPGSVWNPVTHKIVFASTRDPHDEIYFIDENGVSGDEIQVTSRDNYVAYEPCFSPHGEWIAFESHVLDVEGNGIIYKCKSNGEKPYQMLTGANDDCRQPNWSPAGDRILYQKRSGGQWDIWVMNADGSNHEKITNGPGDKTDASFSPDGQWIVYSSDEGGEAFANLYIKPVNGGNSIKITHYDEGYDGAPSWSPGGDRIAFESYPGDPDDSSGTSIWIIDLQIQTPVISLDRTRLNFGFPANSSIPISQTFSISSNRSGSDTVDWQISVSTGAHWLSCTPAAGTGSGIITVTVNPSGLSGGQLSAVITVSPTGTATSSRTVLIVVNVYAPGSTGVPFGEFSTPMDGSTVMSSIPVTGWVLDDIKVDSVKIYRDGEPGLVYIGEAVLVEGARPDVEQAYPDYPFNYKAGWGYMLLTNFLPNSGNGNFKIHAFAADIEGNQVNLGTKTITCENAHAVKPFGALDTPTQGGVASGSSFVNWGWVLTPLPNRIPTDGSYIKVWVDGVSLGNPVYNLYREDIALLFPKYYNSNGAGGYFYLDTTQYANGVHTLQWTATDDGGNTDGIGSRYFTIQNTTNNARVMGRGPGDLPPCLNPHVDEQNDYPFRILKGYSYEDYPQPIYPEENGVIEVKIKELERVEIHLSEGTRELAPLSNCSMSSTNQWQGSKVIGSRLGALPVGSTLDGKRGIFYWQPGPGFVGEYRLVFFKKDQHGNVTRKKILVEIIPF
ncbi:MAG: Ig-like domain-containing protein [Candidatus Aminicenantes bacterium]